VRDGVTQVNTAMERQTERFGEIMAELRDEMRSMREAFERQSSSGTRSEGASTVEVGDEEGVEDDEEEVVAGEVDIEMWEEGDGVEGEEEEEEESEVEAGVEEEEWQGTSGNVDETPASPEHEGAVVVRPRIR
jgi:hypothetical protein